MVLPMLGAFTGIGTLLVGFADFIRNSSRYRREKKVYEQDLSEWRNLHGYL